jgi:hypothetical protein
MTETEILRAALQDCLSELEAAVNMLAREGVIHSPNIGKNKRDGFRALINGTSTVDVSKSNFNIKFPCRRAGCEHACKTSEERQQHEDVCPYGDKEPTRATNKIDKTEKWQGE